MKKKVLLSSIATIALCLCLIAGSTFAMFTSQSQVNIAVTAGKVEVTANISNLTLYSVKANPTSGTVTDEFGYKYDYEKQGTTFVNGGTATLVGNELTLDKVTPGDKVTFTIDIANTSDIATKYRTLVYCTANDGLLSGLEIGLDGDTFNGFAYTEWRSLAAGADIADVAVTVELPVNAGNEYQETSGSLCFIVEAVQGNGAIAYDYLPDLDADGAYEIANAADLFIFASMVNNGAVVNAELTADIDLAGKVWMPIDIVNNQGIVFDGQGYTISNLYALEKDAAGLFGSASCSTISNVNIDKATVISNHYAAGIAAYALCAHIDNCTVKNSNITTSAELLGNEWDNGDKAGAIAGYLSAEPTATVTNCTVEKVTVKGYRDIGGVVGYANAAATITDNTISDSKIICDVSHNYKNYTVADEFDIEAIVGEFKDGAVDSSNTATNVKVDVPVFVFDSEDLVKALENGKSVFFEDDVKIDPAGMSNSYGTTGINVKNGQTVDGNGNILDIKGAGGTWDSGINTTGGIIRDITVTGSFRGIFINHNSTHSEKVILENVIIDGTTYTISCDQGTNQGLEATNSTFNGWTSYAATLGNAKFVDCSFGEGNGYAYCRPYAPTEFVGCNFEAGFEMDARAAVTFENCTIGGVALTADNLATLVTSNTANASVK